MGCKLLQKIECRFLNYIFAHSISICHESRQKISRKNSRGLPRDLKIVQQKEVDRKGSQSGYLQLNSITNIPIKIVIVN